MPATIKEQFPEESEIMLQLVNKDPEKRPSAEDIMKLDTYLKWEKTISSHISPQQQPISTIKEEGSESNSSFKIEEFDARPHNGSLDVITEV